MMNYEELADNYDRLLQDFEALATLYYELKAAIDNHYFARGHDRCWLNDVELYKAAGIKAAEDFNQLPCEEEFLKRCKEYYEQSHTHRSN